MKVKQEIIAATYEITELTKAEYDLFRDGLYAGQALLRTEAYRNNAMLKGSDKEKYDSYAQLLSHML